VLVSFFDGAPSGSQVGTTFTINGPTYDLDTDGAAGSVVDAVSGSITVAGNTTNNLYMKILFERTSAGYQTGLLDNINVTQIPEPSAAALIMGLGGLALILRRRK
jgi:hypothetical protein